MKRRNAIKYGGIALAGILSGAGKIIWDASTVKKVDYNLGTSIDLHSHAVVTYKGSPNLEELTDHCINIGLDILVFTNFVDSRYEDLKKTATSLPKNYEFEDKGVICYVSKDNKLFTIIKGQEIPTKKGHILTVNATDDIKDYNDLSETIKEANDKDAIIIADHPFTLIWGGIGLSNLEKYLDKWDAIETFNSQNIELFPVYIDQRISNPLALNFAKKYNIPSVATSDSHRLNEIALSYITFKEKFGLKERDELISNLRGVIRKQNYECIERSNNWGSFVKWAVPFQIKSKLGLL